MVSFSQVSFGVFELEVLTLLKLLEVNRTVVKDGTLPLLDQ